MIINFDINDNKDDKRLEALQTTTWRKICLTVKTKNLRYLNGLKHRLYPFSS